jgi:hypothetical protein
MNDYHLLAAFFAVVLGFGRALLVVALALSFCGSSVLARWKWLLFLLAAMALLPVGWRL